jgi:hypothetical protein
MGMRRIKPLRSFAAAAVFLAAMLVSCPRAKAQPPPQAQTPTIRVNVDRVNVGVIVTDDNGHFVEGLRREDFRVLDNGVQQPITDFASVTEPAQVLLFIESGPAVVFLGKEHIYAAEKLLDGLSSEDRVAIASYSKGPELLLDFTADKIASRFALDNLNFMLGFGELNLSASLLSTIDWLAALPGKKSVVILSTGVDTSSEEKWQAIERKLQTSDVRILGGLVGRRHPQTAQAPGAFPAGEKGSRHSQIGLRGGRPVSTRTLRGQRRARLFSEEPERFRPGVRRNCSAHSPRIQSRVCTAGARWPDTHHHRKCERVRTQSGSSAGLSCGCAGNRGKVISAEPTG